MNVNRTVKQMMFTYPSIAPSKFSVFEHIFAVIGNGYDWNAKGELVMARYHGQPKPNTTMDYSDLHEREAEYEREIIKRKAESGTTRNDILKLFLAEIDSERMQRMLTEKYMHLILRFTCSRPLNARGNQPRMSHYTSPKGVSYLYAHIFNYPANIAKDWAEAMIDFISWWLVALNTEYGVGGLHEKYDPEKAIAHWPEEAKTLYKRLEAVREDLLIKTTGLSTEERKERTRKMVDSLLAELKEEKSE